MCVYIYVYIYMYVLVYIPKRNKRQSKKQGCNGNAKFGDHVLKKSSS